MRKPTQFFFDRLSISFSAICAMHCAFFPLMLAVFPSIAIIPVEDQVFHEILVWLALPSSMTATYLGCSRHKDLLVLLGTGLGLATLILTAIFGHELLGEKGEKRYSKTLLISITNYLSDENQNKLKLQRETINATYSWDVRSTKWKNFFNEIRELKT